MDIKEIVEELWKRIVFYDTQGKIDYLLDYIVKTIEYLDRYAELSFYVVDNQNYVNYHNIVYRVTSIYQIVGLFCKLLGIDKWFIDGVDTGYTYEQIFSWVENGNLNHIWFRDFEGEE